MRPIIDAERPRFLGDENFNFLIVQGLRTQYPALDVLTFNETTLPEGLEDPLVVEEAARLNRILLTHDKRTMPTHAASVLARWLPVGSHISGVFIILDSLPVAEAIDQISLIWGASSAAEWQDRIVYLPE